MFDVAERICVPREGVFVALIAALGAGIGTQISIRPKKYDPTWLIPPVLWGCIVAPPGSKKSPAADAPMKLLGELEDRVVQDAKPRVEKAKRDHEYYEIQSKTLKNRIQQALMSRRSDEEEELREEMYRLKEPEDSTALPKIITQDATSAMLVRLCSENREGVMLQVDELASLFGACEKKGNEDLRGIFLTGYDANRGYKLDRKTDGLSDFAELLAVSMFGTTQPGALAKEIRRAIEAPDGLLARFQLMVWPTPLEFKNVDRVPDFSAEATLRGIFQKLRPLDWKGIGAALEEEKMPHIGFDADAQSAFYSWQDELHKERIDDPDKPDVLKTHLSKAEKTACSMALIFHICNVLDVKQRPGPITLKSLSLATEWSVVLEQHAAKIYACVSNNARESSEILGQKIKDGRLGDGFKARDVFRNNWGGLNKEDTIQDAIEILESCHWVKEQPQPRKSGRPPKPCYAINPLLKNGKALRIAIAAGGCR